MAPADAARPAALAGGSHRDRSPRLGDDARRRVTLAAVVERLVDMLDWNDADKRGARASVALVVSGSARSQWAGMRAGGVHAAAGAHRSWRGARILPAKAQRGTGAQHSELAGVGAVGGGAAPPSPPVARAASASPGGQERCARGGAGRGGGDAGGAGAEELRAQWDEILCLCMTHEAHIKIEASICFPRWSSEFMLDLFILQLDLQKGSEGLNLQILAGVALMLVAPYKLT
jgi:hypothetical protein